MSEIDNEKEVLKVIYNTLDQKKGEDIEIIDIVPDEGDTDSYTEMGTLYEGKDLADGEVIEVSGVRTNVIVRVYGGDATGTVTIAQKE